MSEIQRWKIPEEVLASHCDDGRFVHHADHVAERNEDKMIIAELKRGLHDGTRLDSRCNCSFSVSIVGDGCRYCQPQTLISRLLDDTEELSGLEDKIAAIKDEVRAEFPDDPGINCPHCENTAERINEIISGGKP